MEGTLRISGAPSWLAAEALLSSSNWPPYDPHQQTATLGSPQWHGHQPAMSMAFCWHASSIDSILFKQTMGRNEGTGRVLQTAILYNNKQWSIPTHKLSGGQRWNSQVADSVFNVFIFHTHTKKTNTTAHCPNDSVEERDRVVCFVGASNDDRLG